MCQGDGDWKWWFQGTLLRCSWFPLTDFIVGHDAYSMWNSHLHGCLPTSHPATLAKVAPVPRRIWTELQMPPFFPNSLWQCSHPVKAHTTCTCHLGYGGWKTGPVLKVKKHRREINTLWINFRNLTHVACWLRSSSIFFLFLIFSVIRSCGISLTCLRTSFTNHWCGWITP